MKKECPFCRINKERNRIIDETENTLTILSNPCLMKGHCLVIPKKHVERLSELDSGERKELLDQVIKMEEILLKKFPGCDIRQNYKPFIEEFKLKVDHLHVHLLPREFEDELYKRVEKYHPEVFSDLSSEELDSVSKMIEELK